MSAVYVQNESANPVLLGDGTRLAPGAACEVEETAVGKRALELGALKKLNELPAAPEEQKDDAGGGGEGGDAPLTLEDITLKLAEEPELIPADSFTSKGAPEVTALEEAFKRDFTAAERDEIWEKVQELNSGSDD